jgi:hypothetical protein
MFYPGNIRASYKLFNKLTMIIIIDLSVVDRKKYINERNKKIIK